jgi:DNA-3-methyladenine glycosylase II
MPAVITKYFDYGAKEIDFLKSVDPVLGEAMERLGKVERVIMPELFTALMHAIVGQLISAKAARTIWERMQERLGEITPANLAVQAAEAIQGCGMTMKKAVCIKNIAQTIAQGDFPLNELRQLPDSEVIKRLTGLKGVGKWTAEMLLIHALERPDIVSWGDIAVRRGMMKLYGLDSLTKEQFDGYRRRYSPYGSVASIYLWNLSFE